MESTVVPYYYAISNSLSPQVSVTMASVTRTIETIRVDQKPLNVQQLFDANITYIQHYERYPFYEYVKYPEDDGINYGVSKLRLYLYGYYYG
jgi:hypothetical protein